MEAFFQELREKEKGMTLILCKLKTQVLNQLTKGDIISDHCVPKEHVLWELHEAEAWWDRKLQELGAYDDKTDVVYGHEVADHSQGYDQQNHLVQEDDDDEVAQV